MSPVLELELDGRQYTISKILDREQLAVECILGHHLGPAIGSALGAMLGELAVDAVKAARAITSDPAWDESVSKDPAAWDLARLFRAWKLSDTKDKHTQSAWDVLTKKIPAFIGVMVAEAVPEMTDRIDHAKLVQLFDMCVIGLVTVRVNGVPKKIANWPGLTDATRANPATKWALLLASLAHTYKPVKQATEEPVDVQEAA